MLIQLQQLLPNDLILLIWAAILIAFLARRQYRPAVVTAAIFAIMAPSIIVGSRRLSPLYILTIILLTECLLAVKRGELKLFEHTADRWFGISMALAFLLYLLGYVVNNRQEGSAFMIAMAGYLQVLLLPLLFYYLFKRMSRDAVYKSMALSILITVAVNLIFAVLQRAFYEQAYRLTFALYASDGRYKPLNEVAKTGYFDRIFGTFYSPTLLGLTALIMLAFLLSVWLSRQPQLLGTPESGSQPDRTATRQARHRACLLLIISALILHLAIIAYTKIVILGLPVFIIYWAILLIFFPERKKTLYQRWAVVLLISTAVYGVTYFTIPAFSHNARNYYYGLLLRPLNSLSSRYGSVHLSQSTQDMENAVNSSSGITASAMGVIKKHWLIGVGPLSIEQEFLGDSQVVQVLHNGGILALLCYLSFYSYVYLKGWCYKNLPLLSLIPAFLIGALAAVAMDSRQMMPFIAFIIYEAAALPRLSERLRPAKPRFRPAKPVSR
ncbi:hypothetical protein HCH52_02395 [Oscillospiraceae bacterium HV4-5-C5C]|nr:hypothetical protein [Oscillospiraceae bacterium HV4-5-C5C]